MAAKKKTGVVAEEMTCKVSDWDQYLFGQGNHYEIYKKLGAHLTKKDGKAGTYFAVWAPRAKSVKVIGEFNNWNGKDHEMTRLEPLGIYDLFVVLFQLFARAVGTFDDGVVENAAQGSTVGRDVFFVQCLLFRELFVGQSNGAFFLCKCVDAVDFCLFHLVRYLVCN